MPTCGLFLAPIRVTDCCGSFLPVGRLLAGAAGGLLGPATLRCRASLRTAGTSVSRRSPGHSTFSAVTEGVRLTLGLALRARLWRLGKRPAFAERAKRSAPERYCAVHTFKAGPFPVGGGRRGGGSGSTARSSRPRSDGLSRGAGVGQERPFSLCSSRASRSPLGYAVKMSAVSSGVESREESHDTSWC